MDRQAIYSSIWPLWHLKAAYGIILEHIISIRDRVFHFRQPLWYSSFWYFWICFNFSFGLISTILLSYLDYDWHWWQRQVHPDTSRCVSSWRWERFNTWSRSSSVPTGPISVSLSPTVFTSWTASRGWPPVTNPLWSLTVLVLLRLPSSVCCLVLWGCWTLRTVLMFSIGSKVSIYAGNIYLI